MDDKEFIQIGHINGVHGVRGWVKIFSDTRPKENIFNYTPWWVETRQGWREVKRTDSRPQGKGLVAQFEGLDDRDQALLWVNCKIGIKPEQLPEAKEGEYYWADLIGLEVVNPEGEFLGKVFELLETGGHDVMVVRGEEGEHLIPFVPKVYILNVDLGTDTEPGKIEVDWQQDYS